MKRSVFIMKLLKVELPADPAYFARILYAQNSYVAIKLVDDPGDFILWCQQYRADEEFAEELINWFCKKTGSYFYKYRKDENGCYTYLEFFDNVEITLQELLTDAPETYMRYMFEYAIWHN